MSELNEKMLADIGVNPKLLRPFIAAASSDWHCSRTSTNPLLRLIGS